MTRGTRIPRTRPSNHHSVMVYCRDNLFQSYVETTVALLGPLEEENDSFNVSPGNKQPKKPGARRKKEAVDVATPQVEEPDPDIEEIQRQINYLDDVADFSLEFEDENGKRMMYADNGTDFIPYDEEARNKRQQIRELRLELSNKIKEKRGEKPSPWLGHSGPVLEKPRAKKSSLSARVPNDNSQGTSTPVSVILTRPDGLPSLRKSIQLMTQRQRTSAVDKSIVYLQKKFIPTARLSFEATSNEESEVKVLPQPKDDSSTSPATTSSPSRSSASESFLHTTASKGLVDRSSAVSTVGPVMFKSTPKRISHVIADLPNFAISPIGRSSSIMPPAHQSNFMTSTPCPQGSTRSKRQEATDFSFLSNSTVTQAVHEDCDVSDHDLCDISALSLADDDQPSDPVKQPLVAMENRLSLQEKQSPCSKRASSENWNKSETVTPKDKKRRTCEVENVDPMAVEEADVTARSLSIAPMDITEDYTQPSKESVKEENATHTLSHNSEPKDILLAEPLAPEGTMFPVNQTDIQQTLVVEPSAFGQTLQVTAMGNTLAVERTDGAAFGDTLGVTLADGTALGNTLAVEPNDFGKTMVDKSGFTNTLMGDITGMSVVPKTRNTTQIVSFYGNESHGGEKTPWFLKDYEGNNDLDRLLFVVKQPNLFAWKELALKNPKKLGEGVYGEVFATMYSGRSSALKIIPFTFEGHEFDGSVNGESLWTPGDLLAEVLITRELAQLNCPGGLFSTPNFIELLGAHVAQGCYPAPFLKAWDAYDKKKRSDNERPTVFSAENRLHLVICLAMGGIDLEEYELQNEAQVLSILLQVALSLMIAEKVLEFEHRDLHVGNILVTKCDEEISYRFNGENIVLVSHGVKINIIDFTLSRLKKDGLVLFRDLSADEELFNGNGIYQYDIYRMMRTANEDNWFEFSSKSNVYWMHYLAKELLEHKKCKKPISAARKKKLLNLFDRLLEFDSISDLFTDPQFTDVISPFLKK